jgi:hypothetical protein
MDLANLLGSSTKNTETNTIQRQTPKDQDEDCKQKIVTEAIEGLKAGMMAKATRSREMTARANEVAAGGKTRCACGARKRASADECTRCQFIKKHPDKTEWASTICIKCKRREAGIGKDGTRCVACEHCMSINRVSIKKRTERCILERKCVSCGGKYGELVTNRLCQRCYDVFEQSKKATPKIKKIKNFSSAVNKLCDDILEIDKFHELATHIKKLVESMTVKK